MQTAIPLQGLVTPPMIETRERKVVVVAGGSRTPRQWIASGIAAIGATLLIPIGILIVGIPIAFALRAVLEVVGWIVTRLS